LRGGCGHQHSRPESLSNAGGCHSPDRCIALAAGRLGVLCLRRRSNPGVVSGAEGQRTIESVGASRVASRIRFPFAWEQKEPSTAEILMETRRRRPRTPLAGAVQGTRAFLLNAAARPSEWW
jgi:hypothetical protein